MQTAILAAVAVLINFVGKISRPLKDEFVEEGTFFSNRFPSLAIFVNKKVGNRKS